MFAPYFDDVRDGEHRIVANGIAHWCRVAGTDAGAGPLVIVHGGPGGNNYVFERTVGPRLETFASVVYYEQRGCGRSAPPDDARAYSMPLLVADLDELRQALGLERIVPLGYSFGAELAAEYALAHPARVSRLILQALSVREREASARTQVDGFLSVASGATRELIARIETTAGTCEAALDRVWREVDGATVDRFLFESAELASVNRTLWKESGLRNTGDMERALRSHADEPAPLRERLGSIQRPTLVLIGRHDRNVGLDASREVADLIPGARLHVFERSAHFPDIEEPESYAEVIRSFVAA